jgi:hypothetical protein
MMGRLEAGQERLFYHFRLEDQVPANHLLRKLDALLDLDLVRKQLEPFDSEIGRPSVDPELMIRMLLIGYPRKSTILAFAATRQARAQAGSTGWPPPRQQDQRRSSATSSQVQRSSTTGAVSGWPMPRVIRPITRSSSSLRPAVRGPPVLSFHSCDRMHETPAGSGREQHVAAARIFQGSDDGAQYR